MKCFLVCSASQAFGGLGALRNVPQSYIIGCEGGRRRAFVARVLRPCCALCLGAVLSHIVQIPRPHRPKMPYRPLCWGWARSEARHIASHASHFASTRREDALQALLLGVGAFRGSTHRVTSLRFCVHTARGCPGVRSVGGRRVQGLDTSRHTRHILRPHGPKMPCGPLCWGVGAFRGSTHRVTRVTFCVHIARRCPAGPSVGGGRVQGLHTWRHIAQISRPHGAKMPWSAFCWGWAFTGLNTSPHARHILRPHGAKMPWSAFCWGWGVHRPPHMASHRSDFASTRREDALECVLLGVGAFRSSTHGVTSLRFRVHTARGCPGVRSVGGGRVHRPRHIAQISRPHGPRMPWSAFCWG